MKSYIKFSQSLQVANDTSIQVNFDFGKTKSLSKLVGTSCNELFELVDLQKSGTIKMFKLSQPIDLTIVGDGFEIDTTKLSFELRTNLKLNSTPKAKARFAQRTFNLVSYVHRVRGIVAVEEITKILND